MKPEISPVAPTFRREYSTKPAAIKARSRYLNDDSYAEAEIARKRRNDAAKKVRVLSATRINRISLDRLRFHLSKGRDVGDIAIRENVTVSAVQQAIAEIKGK